MEAGSLAVSALGDREASMRILETGSKKGKIGLDWRNSVQTEPLFIRCICDL